MPDSEKSKREYKDFKFRGRYDLLLRFRLVGAKPEEVEEIAKELGYKFNSQHLAEKKKKKQDSLKGQKTAFGGFNNFMNMVRPWLNKKI